jgi:hypothetical protein
MFTREKQELKRVPMMPVRDMVIFPQQMTPSSLDAKPACALEEASPGTKRFSCPHSTTLPWTT